MVNDSEIFLYDCEVLGQTYPQLSRGSEWFQVSCRMTSNSHSELMCWIPGAYREESENRDPLRAVSSMQLYIFRDSSSNLKDTSAVGPQMLSTDASPSNFRSSRYVPKVPVPREIRVRAHRNSDAFTV